MTSLEGAAEAIQQAWKLLQHQWQTTASLWTDAAQHRFQKNYMDEYEQVLSTTLNALGQLGQVVAQAERSVQ